MKTWKNKFTYSQIIALGFFTLILFGGTLLSLPISSATGQWTPFTDSLFTATSATCVTGLIVYDTFTHWSLFGQIVIITLIQIGGLGFMTIITLLSLALKKQIGLHERRLLMQSAGTLQIGGIVKLIKRIAIGTIIIEGTGALLLATRFIPQMGWGEGIYNAIFHAVSAFCNAGFDLMGKYKQFSSLTSYSKDIVINVTIMLLIIIGGLGFIVWNDIASYGIKFKKYLLHSKIVLVTTSILVFGGALLFYIFEANSSMAGMGQGERILASFFQSVTPRTAGFNTVEMSALSESGHLLTVILMLIGGSSGSTAGGMKANTLAVLVMGTIAMIRNSSSITAFKRKFDDGIVKQASAVFVLYMFALLMGTLIICAIQPLSMKDVLFETASAAGTVGLTAGITTSLNFVSKYIIMFLMYGGRVGLVTLGLVLAQKRKNILVERPVEKILIG